MSFEKKDTVRVLLPSLSFSISFSLFYVNVKRTAIRLSRDVKFSLNGQLGQQCGGKTTGSEMTETNIKSSSQFLHVVEASHAQPLMQ